MTFAAVLGDSDKPSVGEHFEMASRGGPTALEAGCEFAGSHRAAADAQDCEDLTSAAVGERREHGIDAVKFLQTCRAIAQR
jgi:hypothetical protein